MTSSNTNLAGIGKVMVPKTGWDVAKFYHFVMKCFAEWQIVCMVIGDLDQYTVTNHLVLSYNTIIHKNISIIKEILIYLSIMFNYTFLIVSLRYQI